MEEEGTAGIPSPYRLTATIERQPEGGFLITVPAVPGCYTEGDTLACARPAATSR